MSRWYISTLLSKDIHVFRRLSRKVRTNFYGVENYSDLLAIEYSLPRFATLVPVPVLDVLFQKARFQKLVLLLTNDDVRNLDVWTTSIETWMFHTRGIWFMKEVSESNRQLWNVCWRRNLIHQQRSDIILLNYSQIMNPCIPERIFSACSLRFQLFWHAGTGFYAWIWTRHMEGSFYAPCPYFGLTRWWYNPRVQ